MLYFCPFMSARKLVSLAVQKKALLFAFIGALCGVTQAWTSRGQLYADLLNYLAVARVLTTQGWTSAINGYWSPLYSWFLAMPMAFGMMTQRRELLWVHIINLAIFFWAMFCLHFLLTNALSLARSGVSNITSWSRVEPWVYFAGCAVFLCSTFQWLPVSLTNPDLLNESFLFLALGSLLAIVLEKAGWARYIVFGAALGLGYLAKAQGFLLGILFLVMLGIVLRRDRLAAAKWSLAAAIFLLVAGPFLVGLSKKEGHLTFGESGRVAFVMFGNGLPAYWLGEPVAPAAAGRYYDYVCRDPQVITFPETVPGTFFPSYSPSRWYVGLKPAVTPRITMANLLRGGHEILEILLKESGLIFAVVLLLLLAGVAKGVNAISAWWFVWLPCVVGILMFWIVHVEDRFIAPFLVIGFVGLCLPLLICSMGRSKILITILATLVVVQTSQGILEVARESIRAKASDPVDAAQAIDDLRRAGVPPGATLALIGFPKEEVYWIWGGQYNIKGLVPTSEVMRFEASDATEREKFYACLERTGAKAVLTNSDSPHLLESGWRHVGRRNFYVRILE
jgi:hypothetical protein